MCGSTQHDSRQLGQYTCPLSQLTEGLFKVSDLPSEEFCK